VINMTKRLQGYLLRAGTLLAAVLVFPVVFWPQAAAGVEPIKVGVTVSLSGEYAAPGSEQLQGIQMWAHDLNARGALLGRPVEIVYYDDKSDAETSEALYERLVSEDKVDLLLGPYSSNLTLAASRVAERHHFPMVATGASSTDIWSRGNKYIFQVDAPADTYLNLVITSAKKAGLATIAMLYADADFTRQVAEGVRVEAAKQGMEIVLDEEFSQGSSDFAALVGQMRAKDPDVVIGATYLDGSIAIMKQAKKSGLSPRAFVFTVGPALPQFGEALGPDAEGVLGAVAWMSAAHMPMALDFAFRFNEHYGQTPAASVYNAYGYGAGQVLEAGVRLAGSLDKEDIRMQLGHMKFRSILGAYEVDDTGKQLGKQTYVMQWQHGERRLVLPKQLRDSPIEYPFKPWDER
jgi:branched-chain amino acid transport system substrate-binding protein